MFTLARLRKMSKEGERKKKENYIKVQYEENKKKRLDDIKEAKNIILKAENALAEVAKRGKRSSNIFILRRGLHFKFEIDENNPAKSLEQNLIGKTIYDHFFTRGFKISFVKWYNDKMKEEWLGDRFGYELVVSW